MMLVSCAVYVMFLFTLLLIWGDPKLAEMAIRRKILLLDKKASTRFQPTCPNITNSWKILIHSQLLDNSECVERVSCNESCQK